MVRGLNHKAHSPTAIRSYFQQVHPQVTIRWCDHSFILTHFKAGQSLGGRTPVVFGGSCLSWTSLRSCSSTRRTFFTSCQEVRRWLENAPPKSWLCSAHCCGARDLDHWLVREEELRKEIQQEQEVVFRQVRNPQIISSSFLDQMGRSIGLCLYHVRLSSPGGTSVDQESQNCCLGFHRAAP